MTKNVDFADKIEKFSYMKPFTEEEMAEKRIDLAEKSIKYKGLKEELKKVKESFTVQIFNKI